MIGIYSRHPRSWEARSGWRLEGGAGCGACRHASPSVPPGRPGRDRGALWPCRPWGLRRGPRGRRPGRVRSATVLRWPIRDRKPGFLAEAARPGSQNRRGGRFDERPYWDCLGLAFTKRPPPLVRARGKSARGEDGRRPDREGKQEGEDGRRPDREGTTKQKGRVGPGPPIGRGKDGVCPCVLSRRPLPIAAVFLLSAVARQSSCLPSSLPSSSGLTGGPTAARKTLQRSLGGLGSSGQAGGRQRWARTVPPLLPSRVPRRSTSHECATIGDDGERLAERRRSSAG